jgi:hypothetical protein
MRYRLWLQSGSTPNGPGAFIRNVKFNAEPIISCTCRYWQQLPANANADVDRDALPGLHVRQWHGG